MYHKFLFEYVVKNRTLFISINALNMVDGIKKFNELMKDASIVVEKYKMYSFPQVELFDSERIGEE
jgi:hypothetical protein